MSYTQTDLRIKRFYDRQYAGKQYAPPVRAEEHGGRRALEKFIHDYRLAGRRCLEIGCGRGAFQDLVADYTGVDISAAVRKYMHKPFYRSSATCLPFADSSFDAAWSVWVLEHVPEPELALSEMRRVLRPGGVLLLAPAWQCRSWAAEGYPVRPYGDFGPLGKLVKASIPLRNSVVYRSLSIFPKRIARLASWAATRRPMPFAYKKLKPNYETFWMSDSDAVNSMDPFEAILWFVSRGDRCLSHPSPRRQFIVRTGAVVFQINK